MQLREVTRVLPQADWAVGPEQAQFIALLVQAIGAKHILELGTFTGDSKVAMAPVLPQMEN